MGLGDRPDERDEYEWVSLADLPPARTSLRERRPTGTVEREPQRAGLAGRLEVSRLWEEGTGSRLLLVDLDNLRADPARWRARMSAVVVVAREADHTVLAGQKGAVQRARPHLAEFAAQALPVADGSDLADHALLDAAGAIRGELDQVVVVSNDQIFARLADRAGRLTVLSPGVASLSDRLRDAATRVIDLADMERRLEDA